MFHVLRSASFIVRPAYELVRRLVTLILRWGSLARTLAARVRAPAGGSSPPVRRRRSTALRMSKKVRGIVMNKRTNRDYICIFLHDFRRTNDEAARRRVSSGRATAQVNLAPLWPEAAAPRRHRPRRDRELRVEEALLLKLCVDGRRRVRRQLEARNGGRYAQ